MDAGMMVIKKGWVDIAVGPPFAPSSYKLPAERSWICAVKSFVSKSHNLLLFFRSRPRPVPLRVPDGRVQGLVRQIAEQRS